MLDLSVYGGFYVSLCAKWNVNNSSFGDRWECNKVQYRAVLSPILKNCDVKVHLCEMLCYLLFVMGGNLSTFYSLRQRISIEKASLVLLHLMLDDQPIKLLVDQPLTLVWLKQTTISKVANPMGSEWKH